MSDQDAPHPDGSPTLTLRGGGWLIVATVVAMVVMLAWGLSGIFGANRPIGDGRTIESYQFQLTPMKADAEFLIASGNPRDFLRTLDAPRTMAGTNVLQYNQDQRRKYVVTTDRVAGVALNGESRAYPLAVLNAHEVVNDTLGGVPIAVSFSPLTDSLVVFDRRIGGVQRLFRVSGLLYNSNLVMYDVLDGPAPDVTAAREAADGATPSATSAHVPSLWSQLEARAIAGPAAEAGIALTPLPNTAIASWKQWLALHPDTTIVLPEPSATQRYKEFSYSRYMLTPRIDYPVRNLQAERPEPTSIEALLDAHARGEAPTRKVPAVQVTAGGETAVWSLAHLLAQTGNQDGEWTTRLGGVPIVVTTQRAPLNVIVRSADGSPVVVVPQLWFAHEAFSAAHAPPTTPAKEWRRARSK